MGSQALASMNRMDVPLAGELEERPGEIQSFTPTIEALLVPDIDESLDAEETKRRFWGAFRALGDWYADLPPY
jgi:hypothetical protein